MPVFYQVSSGWVKRMKSESYCNPSGGDKNTVSGLKADTKIYAMTKRRQHSPMQNNAGKEVSYLTRKEGYTFDALPASAIYILKGCGAVRMKVGK